MSRKTRLKPYPKERFSINHHFSYGQSTSHFPNSYSALGKDIKFPTSVVPLQMGEKLVFVGSIDEFFETMHLSDIDLSTVKQASISIKGFKYQDESPVANFGLFTLSAMCYAVSYASKLNSYRAKLYPKYRFNSYDSLEKIIKMFQHVDCLILNIQDNDITLEKTYILENAILKSKIKKCVIRNLSYYMNAENEDEFFMELKDSTIHEFAYVWETFVIRSAKLIQAQGKQKK